MTMIAGTRQKRSSSDTVTAEIPFLRLKSSHDASFVSRLRMTVFYAAQCTLATSSSPITILLPRQFMAKEVVARRGISF